jgi:acetyltransferase-like isoleucine patch superfamily enzyme
MLAKLLRVLHDDPGRIPIRIWSEWTAWRLSLRSNVVLEGKVFLYRSPVIDIRKGCKLYLGKRVVLNSRNWGQHLNFASPCKLFASLPGAEIRIGDETAITGSSITAHRSVVIGKRCMIAANCQIMDSNAHDLSFSNVERRKYTVGAGHPVVIEDDVWIGGNTIVLPGTRIGRGAVIGAGSVVSGTIPPMSVARGNPAQVVFDSQEDSLGLKPSDYYDLEEDGREEQVS